MAEKTSKGAKSLQGWKKNIICGIVATAVALVANIALLIWSSGKPLNEGVRTLYYGSCTKSRQISTVSHLLINLLSTVLLAASNVGLQCLIAPTRHDIDRAHSRGSWMHVGILSLRNLVHISKRRKAVCCILALSSLPLHLLYNSVVFIRTSANDVAGFFVTDSFFHGGTWQSSDDSWNPLVGSWPSSEQILDYSTRQYQTSQYGELATVLQGSIDGLERLETQKCLEVYSNPFNSAYSNVLLVTNATDTNNSIVTHLTVDIGSTPTDHCMVCSPSLKPYCGGYSQDSPFEYCDSYESKTEWNIHYYSPNIPKLLYNEPQNYYEDYGRATPAHVDYCMAAPTDEKCQVALSQTFLVVVVICNVSKLLCLVYLLWLSKWKPLITIGDAISTFLSHGDNSTAGAACLTYKEAQKNMWNPRGTLRTDDDAEELYTRRWYSTTPSWFHGASLLRWGTVLSFCAVFWFTVLGLTVHWFLDPDKGGKVIFSTFGQADPEFLLGRGSSNDSSAEVTSQDLLKNVILANLPQLLLSLFYMLYSNIVTSMLLSREWLSYSVRHKGLRVSQSRGEQRTTFWLTVPLRFAIPLTTVIALLHWTVSESLFLIRVDAYDIHLDRNPSSDIDTCGWSPPAVIVSLIIFACLVIALGVLAVRNYPPGMPLASSCSAAISAACHRSIYDDADVAEKRVCFGVLKDVTATGRHCVGFSAGPVDPLVDGETYGEQYQMQTRRQIYNLVHMEDRSGSSLSLISLPPGEEHHPHYPR